jgi:hypothetical protein
MSSRYTPEVGGRGGGWKMFIYIERGGCRGYSSPTPSSPSLVRRGIIKLMRGEVGRGRGRLLDTASSF